MVWSLVVTPPRETVRALAAALRGLGPAPFAGPGGVLVGPDHAGVDLGVPVQLPGTVGLGPQRGLDPCPGAIGLPAREPLGHGLPGPYRSGRSRHGTPLRTRNKLPLRTWRWSRQRPPRLGVIAGSKGASRSHSWSVISNRRFTAGFYRIACTRPKLTNDPRNTP
jgi:hypothetical protein